MIETLARKISNEKILAEIYDLTDFAFGLFKTNISLTELTPAVAEVTTGALRSGLNIQSQHVPYSGAYANKYYSGMAIVSYDIDDAARRANQFIYG